MTTDLREHKRDGVLEITFDNPGRRNALSLELLAALIERLAAARSEDWRGIVLRGAGEAFSGGVDLADLRGTLDDLAVDDAIEKVVAAIGDLPIPVIAAVEGPCIGGALDLALACDGIVAGADAFFAIPATRLGLLYNPTAICRMHRRVGGAALRRVLLLGERLDAVAAKEAGLVAAVAAKGEAAVAAHCMVQRAAGGSLPAFAATKGVLAAIEDGSYDANHWLAIRREILGSPERHAAIAAAKR
jgi:enoyl-CoA hydratase/carnithine racemase